MQSPDTWSNKKEIVLVILLKYTSVLLSTHKGTVLGVSQLFWGICICIKILEMPYQILPQIFLILMGLPWSYRSIWGEVKSSLILSFLIYKWHICILRNYLLQYFLGNLKILSLQILHIFCLFLITIIYYYFVSYEGNSSYAWK